ncbi:hypothetical protein Bca4012_051535 [Brassica carinata]
MNKEECREERTRCIEIDKMRFVKERRATREMRREEIRMETQKHLVNYNTKIIGFDNHKPHSCQRSCRVESIGSESHYLYVGRDRRISKAPVEDQRLGADKIDGGDELGVADREELEDRREEEPRRRQYRILGLGHRWYRIRRVTPLLSPLCRRRR